MITVAALKDGKAFTQTLADGAPLPAGALWVDLQGCSPAQLAQFSQLIKQPLPALREVRLIEQSRQHYAHKGVTYLTAPIIFGSQSDTPTSGVVLFVLTPQLLITVREGESRALSQFASRLPAEPNLLGSSERVFVGILESLVHRLADLGEMSAHELEQVGRIVLSESLQRTKAPGQGRAGSWRKIMLGLGKTARLNHRLLATLTGLDRLLAFVQTPQEPCVSEASYPQLKLLQEDIRRLIEHMNGMMTEATFLLDTIIGAISVEQNTVIKIFSMVAVVLMPPTMIASIYGMNFQFMPELAQPWGYPVALLAMLLSGLLPWLWFKRNGWF